MHPPEPNPMSDISGDKNTVAWSPPRGQTWGTRTFKTATVTRPATAVLNLLSRQLLLNQSKNPASGPPSNALTSLPKGGNEERPAPPPTPVALTSHQLSPTSVPHRLVLLGIQGSFTPLPCKIKMETVHFQNAHECTEEPSCVLSFFFFKEVCLRRSCILDVTKIATLVFNAVYLNINITCALDRMPHYLHWIIRRNLCISEALLKKQANKSPAWYFFNKMSA